MKGDIYKRGHLYNQLNIIGYVDDSKIKQGQDICGLPVLGYSNELDTILSKNVADAIVIAISDIEESRLTNIRKACKKQNIRCFLFTHTFEELN